MRDRADFTGINWRGARYARKMAVLRPLLRRAATHGCRQYYGLCRGMATVRYTRRGEPSEVLRCANAVHFSADRACFALCVAVSDPCTVWSLCASEPTSCSSNNDTDSSFWKNYLAAHREHSVLSAMLDSRWLCILHVPRLSDTTSPSSADSVLRLPCSLCLPKGSHGELRVL